MVWRNNSTSITDAAVSVSTLQNGKLETWVYKSINTALLSQACVDNSKGCFLNINQGQRSDNVVNLNTTIDHLFALAYRGDLRIRVLIIIAAILITGTLLGILAHLPHWLRLGLQACCKLGKYDKGLRTKEGHEPHVQEMEDLSGKGKSQVALHGQPPV